jgi:hypothetical protein
MNTGVADRGATDTEPVRVSERAGPAGLTVLEVATGALELAFLPALGGRLWSMRIDGTELLWRDEQAWRATEHGWINAGGSKTWPAPQDAWGGPPGPIDGDPFEVAIETSPTGLAVVLTGAPDASTGLQVERRFDIPPGGAGFAQSTTFHNIAYRTVTWAIWEVCQLDLSAGASIEVDADADAQAPVALGGAIPAIRDDRTWRMSPGGAHGKVGFPGASGTARFRRDDGAGFEWRFDPEPGLAHPDGDSRVTVYARAEAGRDARTAYAELEALSALVALAPGERMVQRLDWSLLRAR